MDQEGRRAATQHLIRHPAQDQRSQPAVNSSVHDDVQGGGRPNRPSAWQSGRLYLCDYNILPTKVIRATVTLHMPQSVNFITCLPNLQGNHQFVRPLGLLPKALREIAMPCFFGGQKKHD
jgi:hypothetical protein